MTMPEEYPKTLNFMVNDICNSRCKMCRVWEQKPKKEMSAEEFSVILGDPLFQKVNYVGVSGGEPTLRADLPDIFRIIAGKESIQGTGLITNALHADQVIEQISKCNDVCHQRNIPFNVMVSLDGIGKIHDQVRGRKGAYENAVKVIRHIRDKTSIALTIGCTVVRHNVWHLDEVLDFCHRENVVGRFRIGEFIQRLYNSDLKANIRNFNRDERYQIALFFSKLEFCYETSPNIKATYRNIRRMVFEGKNRESGCPYRSEAIGLDSRGNLLFCSPKSPDLGSCLNQSASIIYKEKQKVRNSIIKNHCATCIHDYHAPPSNSVAEACSQEIFFKNLMSVRQSIVNSSEISPAIPETIDWSKLEKVLIIGWYGTETIGDKAIIGDIIRRLKLANSKINISVASLYPFITQRTAQEIESEDVTIIPTYSSAYIDACRTNDAVIMGGGPLMGMEPLGFVLTAFSLARKENIPTIIEGCGIGPLNEEIHKLAVKEIIRLSTEIKIRDEASLSWVYANTDRKDAVCTGDSALGFVDEWINRKVDHHNERDGAYFTCLLREITFEYANGNSAQDFQEFRNKFEQELGKLIRFISEKTGLKPLLMPMHTFAVGQDDRDFARRFAASYLNEGNYEIGNKVYSPHDILATMDKSKFNVCMRFHSVLFAEKLDVPFLAIDYTGGGKIKGFLKDKNKLDLMLDRSDISNKHWKSKVDSLLLENNLRSAKIVHLCTQDFGGAGKAAYRLHKGLQKIGVTSTMLVLNKKSKDPSVKIINNKFVDPLKQNPKIAEYESALWLRQVLRWQTALEKYPNRPAGLEMFTDALSDIQLEQIPEVMEADIINLHWVAGLLDYANAPLLLREKQIVWTLHDMNPFTGGCHYSGNCTKYQSSCGACPQLGSTNEEDLSREIWNQKNYFYNNLNLHVVTPSKWLAKCVSHSQLLSKKPVEVIPNGFPLDIFFPKEKTKARQMLNLPKNAKVILFGADSVVNARKGFVYLLGALNKMASKRDGDFVVLTFGNLPEGLQIDSKYAIHSLGSITDENKLAYAYSAADVFVIPSLEDNLPNTVIEAMSCGVPVVGFEIGGIPDMIEHKKNGFIAKPKDISSLLEGIDWALSLSDEGIDVSTFCRNYAENKFSQKIQAEAYKKLYTTLMTPVNSRSATNTVITTDCENTLQQLELIYRQALSSAENGKFDEAIETLEKLISKNPAYAKAHNDLGVLYCEKGEYIQAQRHYEKAIGLDPDSVTFKKNYAEFNYVILGRVEKALKIYINLLQAHPMDIEVLLSLGKICTDIKKYDDAEAFFSKVRELDPANAVAKSHLRQTALNSNDQGHNRDEFHPQTRNDNTTGEYLVSAIVSTYNSERFIEACLKDLLGQTIAPKVEIIVINSGSEQNEDSIIKTYQKSHPNIRYIKTEQRESVYAAWNRGIRVARGKYITNANTDDRHCPDAFEIMVRALEENPESAAVYADCLITDNENETFEKNTARQYFDRPNFNLRQMLLFSFFGPQPMWRRSVHKKIGYFDTSLSVAADYDFFIRLAREYDAFHIGEILGLYTRRRASIENSNRTLCVSETSQVLRRYRSIIPLESIYPDLNSSPESRAAIGACLADQGNCCLFGDLPDIENALNYYIQAMEYGYAEPELAANLGIALYLCGKKKEGIDLLNRNAGKVSAVTYNLGMIDQYSKKGNIPPVNQFRVVEIQHPVIRAAARGKGLVVEDNSLVPVEMVKNQWTGAEMIRDIIPSSTKRMPTSSDPAQVSVIVRTMNRPLYLEECLASIAVQTYRDFEVVVVNDGGVNIDDIIDRYSHQMRVVYRRHSSNKGRTASLNTGLKSAGGTYITYLDDDDRIYPNHFERLVKELTTGKYSVAYSDSLEVQQEANNGTFVTKQKRLVYSQDFDRNLLEKTNYIPILNLMHHRDCVKKVGVFDENLTVLEDWDYWIRLAQFYDFKHIPEVTAEYRVRNDNSNATAAECHQFPRCREHIRAKLASNAVKPPSRLNRPLVSMVILSRNQVEYTQKCIDSILQFTQPSFEVIVVDNGSTDGTHAYLDSLIGMPFSANPIKVIKNKENLGFAAGNNLGIAAAKGAYILLMNNDIVVTPGWLDRLIETAERNPQSGIIGPKSNNVSGPQLIKDVDYDPQTLEGLRQYSERLAERYAGKAQRLLRVVGFCMLIKRDVINKIGGLDDRYGLGNFEDDDFSLRAAMAGFQSWMAEDCFVHHFGSRTFIGEKIDYRESLLKNWEIFKNKWGLPKKLPYGEGYRLDQISDNQFDPAKHFVPLAENSRSKEGPTKEKPAVCGNNSSAFKEVQSMLEDQNVEGAIAHLENLVAENPNHALAYNDLGVLYYRAGKKNDALKCYQRATAIELHNITFKKNLADFLCLELNQVEEALKTYLEVLEADPNDIETLMAIATVCMATDKFEDARFFYNKVLELEPDNALVQEKLDQLSSNIHPEQNNEQTTDEYQCLKNEAAHKRVEDMIPRFEAWKEAHPNFPAIYSDLGTMYHLMGEKEKALSNIQKAVELDPYNSDFRNDLADYLLTEINDVDAALEAYHESLDLRSNDIATLMKIGHLYAARKDFVEAEKYYTRVLDIDPDYPEALKFRKAIWNKGHSKDTAPPTEDHLCGSSDPVLSREDCDLPNLTETGQDGATSVLTSIIVVLDGTQNRIKRCISSIENHTQHSYELILVCNSAGKGVKKWAKSLVDKHEHIHRLLLDKKVALATTLNRACQDAKGQRIVILHSDVVVGQDWLSALLECVDHDENVGVVGPMANKVEGRQQSGYEQEVNAGNAEEFAREYGKKFIHRRIPVDEVAGFCLVFKPDLIEQIGPFDTNYQSERYLIKDFCRRASLRGFQNYIAGGVYLYHADNHGPSNQLKANDHNRENDRAVFNAKWNGFDIDSPVRQVIEIKDLIDKGRKLFRQERVKAAVDVFIQAIGMYPQNDRLYIELANELKNYGKFQQALDTLTECPNIDADAMNKNVNVITLKGYCEEGLGNDRQAEVYANQALKHDSSYAPALNLKGILAFKKGNVEAAQALFQQAIDADHGFGEAYTNLGAIYWEQGEKEKALEWLQRGFVLSPLDLEITNLFHTALTELNKFDFAENIVRDIAAIYEDSKRLQYLLIDIFIQQNKYPEAIRVIENAIAEFGYDDGIGQAALKIRQMVGPMAIDNQNKGKPTVSLCMIVKNEEKDLARCLASIKPIVDEMIIVDTGSTDKTKDIAAAFGAKVYDYEWKEDFAAARNQSLSKATGDWVLIMDADEVISSKDYRAFRRVVARRPNKTMAYSITTRNYNTESNIIGWIPNSGQYRSEEAGSGWLPSFKVRLFTRTAGIRFEGAVHEMVDGFLKRKNIKPRQCSIPVHHYGRLDKTVLNRKGNIYYEIGRKKLAELGDNVEALRELAVQATILEKNEEALALWQKLLAHNINPMIKAHAFINMGTLYSRMGQFEESLKVSQQAQMAAPQMKEANYNFAMAELHLGNAEKAVSILESLLEKQPDYPPAQFVLITAYLCNGQKQEGLEGLKRLQNSAMGHALVFSVIELAKSLIAADQRAYALRLLETAFAAGIANKELVHLLALCNGQMNSKQAVA